MFAVYLGILSMDRLHWAEQLGVCEVGTRLRRECGACDDSMVRDVCC